MSFKKRLIETLKTKGVTAYRLAKDLGISEGTVRNWKRGINRPGADHAVEVSRYLGVALGWLMYGEGEGPGALNSTSVRVVATLAQAQLKGVAETTAAEGYITLPDLPLEALALKVHDEAMSPTLRTGDYIVFVETGELRNGEMAVLADKYGALHVRRLRKLHGEGLLTAENRDYPVVKVGAGFDIVGKAIKVWRELGF